MKEMEKKYFVHSYPDYFRHAESLPSSAYPKRFSPGDVEVAMNEGEATLKSQTACIYYCCVALSIQPQLRGSNVFIRSIEF